MAAENTNDWIGNLLMNWILNILIYIVNWWGIAAVLMPILGSPTFFYDTISGFGLLPEEVEEFETPLYSQGWF